MLSKIDAEKAISGVNGKMLKERPLAVDWALSKSKWEDVKDQIEAEVNTKGQGDRDEENEGSVDDEEQSNESDDGLWVHSDGDVSMHSGSEEDEDDRGSPSKPELPPLEAGTTLFIRNVPWEATEDELRQLFRAFGSLRYVRIVIDHESGRSKGTAFACYWKKEDADKVVTTSETLNKETNPGTVAKNPFSAPSLLTPDPSSSLARTLVIHGRTLDVVRAVTRETAGKLHEAGVKMREKADKRNLYLMREGVIFPNSPAASTIPPAELEKRMNAFNARRNLIRTNPSLFVSKTRLSIRQLPTFVSERCLKRLAHHAIKTFDEEVVKGDRDGLEEEEMQDEDGRRVVDPLSGAEVSLSVKQEKERGKKGGRKGKGGGGAVKQAKIVRLSERVDPLTGKGKSKGYGFLEMEKHADALKVLRWANNNPEMGKLLKSWWMEGLKEALSTLEAKGGKRSEEESTRMKRLKEVIANSDLDNVEKANSKRTLVVEFSIENAVIIKKREGRDQIQPSGSANADKRNQRRKPNTDHDDQSESSKRDRSRIGKKNHDSNKYKDDGEYSRPLKRRKVENQSTGANSTPLSDRIGDKKPANALGSIIGRKRKMKKTKSGRK
ncbi:RNA recognition motif-containing protein [Serendipita sp. 399]|nr:RNA recognition motif-containing protein [Serendipita sp. 399]